MKKILLYFILSSYISVCCAQTNGFNPKCFWKSSRGVNAGTNLQKQDIADLKSWNVNLLRISFATMPLMERQSPYSLNQKAFDYLDSVLNWCENPGISVIIDPHYYPGMGNQWTMLGNDSIWLDFKYHNIIINFWDQLSKRYCNRGIVIAAYDILNEPETNPVIKVGTPGDINLLYSKVVEVIRKNDQVHTISLALPRFYKDGKMFGYHKGINLIRLPNDDNLVLQSHSYMPEKFTHQNVWEKVEFVHYPNEIDGVKWNFRQLKKEQTQLIEFSRRNKQIPILIGEFSCPRWTGKDGDRYLKDVIKIAEENGWSWAYHSFRESPVWDAEIAENKDGELKRDSSGSRLKLLKKSFAKNKTN